MIKKIYNNIFFINKYIKKKIFFYKSLFKKVIFHNRYITKKNKLKKIIYFKKKYKNGYIKNNIKGSIIFINNSNSNNRGNINDNIENNIDISDNIENNTDINIENNIDISGNIENNTDTNIVNNIENNTDTNIVNNIENNTDTNINNIISKSDIKIDNLVSNVDTNIHIIKFCVFLGREKNMRILHSYIELALEHNIIDEYHMFDFSKDINNHDFIMSEYTRLNSIFNNHIFLHNYNENILFKNNSKAKTNWNPFYKIISTWDENDVVIKCDDDILFLDIFSLQNSIRNRIEDKISFVIHSNCINNGVCAYYQSNLFFKLKEHINKYPTGGILGILFEKPEIAYAMHTQFFNDILLNLENLNKYIIDDVYINIRISINFILINGIDLKYLGDVEQDDEYMLSSFIPEKLCRPNKIKGDLITSHLSYSFQEKIILNRDDILNNYKRVRDLYINKNKSLIKIYNKLELIIPKCHLNNNIYKIKNWNNSNHYYIKNIDTDKYLYINYDTDELSLNNTDKTFFEIINKKNNIIEIKLGIFYLTRYNSIGKFRNENILFKYLKDSFEKELLKEDIEKDLIENDNDIFYLKFLKYNNYLSTSTENNNLINIYNQKCSKWKFEKVVNQDKYINVIRFIKNNKFYYKNINTDEIYTNYYYGWGTENILW
jgi:hypothetical protein